MLDPKENRETWLRAYRENRELFDREILPSIEQNRKGFCKLHFVREDGTPLAHTTVTVKQDKHDFRFGAHLFMLDEFADPRENAAYRRLFPQYFNLATLPFYWNGLEPEEGKPRFDKNAPKRYRRPSPELCMEYCEEEEIDAKLHCLVYDNFIPSWLPKSDMAKMEAAYDKRIREIAERYRGRLWEFEVINETLGEAFWTDQSVIMNKRDLLPWAFSLARKYLPNETLVINEGYSSLCAVGANDYRDPYFMQVENALRAGTCIDKVGIQHHIFTGAATETAEEYEAAVRRGDDKTDPAAIWHGLNVLSELGLPLELTEVTIPTFGDTEEDEQLQADLLEMLYTVWFAHPSVDAIVYWNTVEGYAYDKKGWHENNCRGGLFHHDLTPKKSALALRKLLNETWHTEFTAETDEHGYLEFRGFFGDYTAEAENAVALFDLHRDESPVTEIEVER